MSPTDWGTCPACYKRAKDNQIHRQKQVQESYGKIPIDDFLRMKAEADKEIKMESALREDYHIGICTETGEFEAWFRCNCTHCDFVWEFKHPPVNVFTYKKSKGKTA